MIFRLIIYSIIFYLIYSLIRFIFSIYRNSLKIKEKMRNDSKIKEDLKENKSSKRDKIIELDDDQYKVE